MSQNIQDLIEKIKQEGFESAGKKAEEIEASARKKADEILAGAKAQADKIIAEAAARQKQTEAATRESLRQAARDTLLSVRQSVGQLLDVIIRRKVREALTPQEISALLREIVRSSVLRPEQDPQIVIGLSEENRTRLQEGVLAELQREMTSSGLRLETDGDTAGGFTISFDGGKSCFDMSESALADYLGMYVNDYVKALMETENKK